MFEWRNVESVEMQEMDIFICSKKLRRFNEAGERDIETNQRTEMKVNSI